MTGEVVVMIIAAVVLVAGIVIMVKNKEMKMSYERLLLPVKILNAIYESYKTGKEVEIK